MAIETPASVVFRGLVGMIGFDGWEVSSVFWCPYPSRWPSLLSYLRYIYRRGRQRRLDNRKLTNKQQVNDTARSETDHTYQWSKREGTGCFYGH